MPTPPRAAHARLLAGPPELGFCVPRLALDCSDYASLRLTQPASSLCGGLVLHPHLAANSGRWGGTGTWRRPRRYGIQPVEADMHTQVTD